MRFTYCPICGMKLVNKDIGDEGLLPFCSNCSRPYFDWFGLCIITAVINEMREGSIAKQLLQACIK